LPNSARRSRSRPRMALVFQLPVLVFRSSRTLPLFTTAGADRPRTTVVPPNTLVSILDSSLKNTRLLATRLLRSVPSWTSGPHWATAGALPRHRHRRSPFDLLSKPSPLRRPPGSEAGLTAGGDQSTGAQASRRMAYGSEKIIGTPSRTGATTLITMLRMILATLSGLEVGMTSTCSLDTFHPFFFTIAQNDTFLTPFWTLGIPLLFTTLRFTTVCSFRDTIFLLPLYSIPSYPPMLRFSYQILLLCFGKLLLLALGMHGWLGKCHHTKL